MVPTLENGLIKLHLRTKERVLEGRYAELVYEAPISEERSISMVVPPKSSSPKKVPRMVALPKKGVNPPRVEPSIVPLPLRFLYLVTGAVSSLWPYIVLCLATITLAKKTWGLAKLQNYQDMKKANDGQAKKMAILDDTLKQETKEHAAVNAVRLKYVLSTIWSNYTDARRKTSLKDPTKSSSPKKALRMVALPKNMRREPRPRLPQVRIVNETDPTVSFRVMLERAAILLLLPLFYSPGTCARALRLEDELVAVQILYHWSGVVTLIGVILVVPALIIGAISLRKEKDGRRAHEAEEGGQADEPAETSGEAGGGPDKHFTT